MVSERSVLPKQLGDFLSVVFDEWERRGREAREVMAVLDRAFAGVGDDDPCPCDSGRRFGDCHARRVTS